ncbi:hypothetical protein ElyMa_002516300 [Elysia marginata]|uniref:Uncharacterized protein n=1 Tax=Elysia marginata TaxID=1093978 RepID=A0AAV4GS78_9GAST|nr:hypothetical protein ElyMa_002516300 [Elysia marginata]
MASGDSFLNTLTIEGECDRSCNLKKFKDPLVYIRLPASIRKRASGKGKLPANHRRRGQSLPPAMGRQRFHVSPPTPACHGGSGSQVESRQHSRAARILTSLWLPVCFTLINAVCHAIDSATGALMMTYSTLLLHHMGAVGRGVTAFISVLALTSLLLHGSDMIYILLVHAVYYCAVSMGKTTTEEYLRTKRPYTKKSYNRVTVW